MGLFPILGLKLNDRSNDSWKSRINTDPDFDRLKKLQTLQMPSIVWSIAKTKTQLKIARLIAKLWVEVPQYKVSVCRFCEQILFTNLSVHYIASCLNTALLRDQLFTEIYETFDNLSLYDEFRNCNSDNFYLLALGMPAHNAPPDQGLLASICHKFVWTALSSCSLTE